MAREVLVRGGAEVLVRPDRALLHVTLDADAGSRDDAYRAAARTATVVDAAFEQHAAATERVVTTALAVQPLTRWRKGELIRTGWRAARRSRVEVVAFESLGSLVADLVAADATVEGPQWVVDPTNPGYDEVRTAAVRDARRRAEAYAAGLGVELGPVRWIAEPGLRLSAGQPPAQAMFAAAPGQAFRGGPAEPEEVVIEVDPADIRIEATVEVAFELGGD